jgi:hypothetical protein
MIARKQIMMNMKLIVSPIIATNVKSSFEIDLMTRKYRKNLNQDIASTAIMK